MKSLVQVVAIGVIVMMAGAVLAEGECDKYKTSYDVTYCY